MSEHSKLDVLDLVVYSRSLAVMMNAGVSLVRDLTILQALFDEPLRSATGLLYNEVSAGATLSAAMGKRPDVFTRLYAHMVRVGEVGGVLDETCQQVADLLEADWANARDTSANSHGLLMPCRAAEPSFGAAAPDDQMRMLSLYFRALGTMLTAGVPVTAEILWDTAAGILPPGPERDALAAMAAKVHGSGRLESEFFRLPFLPDFALQLVSISIETGTFALMCEKIAQLLEYQRRYYLLKQGKQA